MKTARAVWSGGLWLFFLSLFAVLTACGGGGGGDEAGSRAQTVELTQITVTPEKPQIAKGTTQQFKATATYSNSKTEDVTAQATWTSSDDQTASVTAGGQAKGLKEGKAEIKATFNGKSAATELTVTAAVVTALQVSPTHPSIAKGTTQQFQATAILSDGGTQDLSATVTWASSDATVASVSNLAGSQGKATALKLGQTTITVTHGKFSANTMLTVTAATLTEVQVTPATPSVPKGTTQQFTATALFSDNSTQAVTGSATWTSSGTTVAQVSDSGDAKGLTAARAVGTATIRASFGGKIGETEMTVTPAYLTAIDVTPANAKLAVGFKRTYTATGTYSDGTTRNLSASVTWTSSDEAKATISDTADSKGVASGVAAGQTSIGATLGPVTGSTVLTVTNASLSSIQVTPANPSVAKGRSQKFAATGLFSDNSSQDLTTQVTWASSNEGVATVDNAAGREGLAQTVDTGSSSISAARGAVSGSTTLNVTAAVLTSLAVTPDPVTLCPGVTQAFTATGTFSDNSSSDVTTAVTWSSSATDVATISNANGSKGVANSVRPGTTTITAKDPGTALDASAELTVTGGSIVGITLSPADARLPLGFFRDYLATGQFSDCPQRDITADVTWTSLSPAVATISNAAADKGRASAVAAGTTSITASLGSASGNTAITVTSASLSSIDVTPKNASISGGQSLQFTAVGSFSDSSTLPLTRQVTWASSNTNAATISNASGSEGLATAGVLIGTTTISATRDDVSGSTTLTRAP